MISISLCITWFGNPSIRVADTPLWREFVEHVRKWGQLIPVVVTMLVEEALERLGPRALGLALRFAQEPWTLDRVLLAMLRRGEIRDLEDRLKGLSGRDRIAAGQALLALWEQAA
jgi:hypothetical protein